jgi:hypothetical protein
VTPWTRAVAEEMAAITAAQDALYGLPQPWPAELEEAFGLLCSRFQTLTELDPDALDA